MDRWDEADAVRDLDNEIEKAEKLAKEMTLREKIKSDDYEQRRKAGLLTRYEQDSVEERARRKKEDDKVLRQADEIRQRRRPSNDQSTKTTPTITDEELEELALYEKQVKRSQRR